MEEYKPLFAGIAEEKCRTDRHGKPRRAERGTEWKWLRVSYPQKPSPQPPRYRACPVSYDRHLSDKPAILSAIVERRGVGYITVRT